MTIPNPTTLRKAIAIKTELEHLDRKLEELLSKASSQVPVKKETAKASKVSKEPLHTLSKETAPDVAKETSQPISEEAPHDVKKENEQEASAHESTTHHDVVGVLSSSDPHQETLLLVEDDGEEQLAIIPVQENPVLDAQPSQEENCHLPLGFDHVPHES